MTSHQDQASRGARAPTASVGRHAEQPWGALDIPGYTVGSEIYRGRTRVLYRAARDTDGQMAVVKTSVHERPTLAVAAGLRREYDILRDLDVAGVPAAYAFLEETARPSLVLEDRGGTPLSQLITSRPLTIEQVLEISSRLAGIVGELHNRRIIHKDINPKNILVDLDDMRVTLFDFGHASRLPFERQRFAHPNSLEGTLAYMSPEQTGRMNRDLDYRSDLYSLGVTMYEMLTGRLPFQSTDPLEVVHCHLAQTPVPSHALDPAIPQPVSDVVMKLLAKTPEERYQSAYGLQNDLGACLDELKATGQIKTLVVGQHDVADQFVIPQRLYGRDAERAELLRALERVSAGGTELVTVCGYSGIGKTSLIHELHRALTRTRGYFIAGKCEQLTRSSPYAAIVQAFSSLVRQILTESEESVSAWKSALLGALGHSGQVIIDVIPDLQRIIGPQPVVPDLGGIEAQNRFSLLFQKQVATCADTEHPLVLFLDDLQWAPTSTLNLVQAFLLNEDLHGLLLVGAYRDNEVAQGDPLLTTLAALEDAGLPHTAIELLPLAQEHVNAFLSDTLRADRRHTEPLSTLVLEKTAGNPFFVIQFIKALHEHELIVFDYDTAKWTFDLSRIETMEMTDNVVDLMANKIRTLPRRTQEALRLAACIGGRFDLRRLATVSQRELEATVHDVWAAIEQGLVLPIGEGTWLDTRDANILEQRAVLPLRFLHDRVQQAAYELIPENMRPDIHLTIGRLLLAGHDDAEIQERIFEIVNQLNYGVELLEDDAERDRVAELNYQAGLKAKSSAAYPIALRHFAIAARLLADGSWDERYEFAFQLHRMLAESYYLCGEFETAEETFTNLLQRARSALDKAEVHRLRVIQNENMSRYEDAIAAATSGLQLFGVTVPHTENEKSEALSNEIRAIRERLGAKAVQDLIQLPQMTDPEIKMCMKLLMAAWAPAYIAADRGLSAWLPAKMVSLSLEHGNTEESASGYVMHGITVGSVLNDYATGHAFGRLALSLNDQLDDLGSRAKVYEQFGCFVNLWRDSIKNCIKYCRVSHQAGLESGDFTYASYAIFVESWYAFLTSTTIRDFQDDYGSSFALLDRIKMHSFAEVQKLILQWSRALAGLTRSPTALTDDTFDETVFNERYTAPFFQVFYWVPRLHLLYTFERYDAAREAAIAAEHVIDSLSGTIWPTVLGFYQALSLAATYAAADSVQQRAALRKIEGIEERFKTWSDNCPQNFHHRYLLVSAEKARVTGRELDAIDCFEAALEAAEACDSSCGRALANELYGKFWRNRGSEKAAAICLTDAYRIYADWGASAKAAHLMRTYPALIGPAAPVSERVMTSTVMTSETHWGALDLSSVLKAADVLAGEIDLGVLLQKLVRILIENAAARRGVLILESDGEWHVQAEGSVDSETVTVLQDLPVTAQVIPESVVHYVRRTGESVVLQDATEDETFGDDPYIARSRPQSVLCAPVHYRGRLLGLVYLENDLTAGAFTADRVELVQLLSSHAATAIRNAALFAEVTSLRDRLQAENVYLHEEIKAEHGFEDVIGRSQTLTRVLRQVEQVAPTDTTVLITGETGTGKELIARAIHARSRQPGGPFITVNCGALSPGLVESELFGHEKGAFTGAVARKIGRFELADGGTLFLDEIGDLPADAQVKLLRALQENEIERVGGTKPIKVHVRVIAATHQPLETLVETARFRSDLYYRINVFPIATPPLRDRPEDIPLLARYFVMEYAAKLGKRIDSIPKRILDTLSAYSWPGNIRELRNIIERSIILTQGSTFELADWAPARSTEKSASAGQSLLDLEREHILRVLEQTGWRVSGPKGAASILGLKRTTLEAKMKKLGIKRPG